MKIKDIRKNYIINENKRLMNKLDYLIDILNNIEYSLNYIEQNKKTNFNLNQIHSNIEFLGNKILFLDISKNNFKLLNSLIVQAKRFIKFYSVFLDKRYNFNKSLFEQINNIDF